MRKRRLGNQGLEVSSLGLGCLGMSKVYGPFSGRECLRVLDEAFALGIHFWDTAELYGPHTSELFLGRALKKRRDKVVVASKFGLKISSNGDEFTADSRPEQIRRSLEGSLKRLRTDYIDLYFQHRLDPNVPIEESMGALADLVKEGKIRFVGLCEVGTETIRRAHVIHPLSAIESEYSIWERGIETTVLPLLHELDIGFVAYSPIGRGFLTGRIASPEALDPNDWRHTLPRFQPSNFSANLHWVDRLKNLAHKYEMTMAQLALAWVYHRAPNIVPIPGTSKRAHLRENIEGIGNILPPLFYESIEAELSPFRVSGSRYSSDSMKWIAAR